MKDEVTKSERHIKRVCINGSMEDTLTIAQVGELSISAMELQYYPSTQEIAKRIAACMNACEGISTEALEGGAIQSLLNALKEAFDLLRPIVHYAVNASDLPSHLCADLQEASDLLDSAISKATTPQS